MEAITLGQEVEIKVDQSVDFEDLDLIIKYRGVTRTAPVKDDTKRVHHTFAVQLEGAAKEVDVPIITDDGKTPVRSEDASKVLPSFRHGNIVLLVVSWVDQESILISVAKRKTDQKT